MTIAYLEAACNEDNKTFLSLKRLADVNLFDGKQKESVFDIMLEELKTRELTEKEKISLLHCENTRLSLYFLELIKSLHSCLIIRVAFSLCVALIKSYTFSNYKGISMWRKQSLSNLS